MGVGVIFLTSLVQSSIHAKWIPCGNYGLLIATPFLCGDFSHLGYVKMATSTNAKHTLKAVKDKHRVPPCSPKKLATPVTCAVLTKSPLKIVKRVKCSL